MNTVDVTATIEYSSIGRVLTSSTHEHKKVYYASTLYSTQLAFAKLKFRHAVRSTVYSRLTCRLKLEYFTCAVLKRLLCLFC